MINESARSRLRLWFPTILAGVALYAALTNLEGFGKLLSRILGFLSPVLLGGALALILNVPLRGFSMLIRRADTKKRLSDKWREIISLVLVLITMPLVIGLVITFFVPQFATAVASLITIISENRTDIVDFTSKFGLDATAVEAKIKELTDWITNNLGSIAGITVNTAVSIFNSVTSIVMSVMMAIYVLLDKHRIGKQGERTLRALLPERASNFICRVWSLFVETFSRFISRQLLEAVILGCILFLGMSVFRLPYALSICCLTIVLALIPYVGALMSMIVGVVMILLVDPDKALVFAIMFIVVQQIEGNVIYPRVVGESVGLPAYITLIAVTLGGEMLGITGMLLFVPLASVLYTLLRDAVDKREPETLAEAQGVISAPPPPETIPIAPAPKPAYKKRAKKKK